MISAYKSTETLGEETFLVFGLESKLEISVSSPVNIRG
jgi:hypothetical protein